MTVPTVTTLQLVPLEVGQSTRIPGRPRDGDRLVLGAGQRKLSLRCPVSGKGAKGDRFLTVAEVPKNDPSPSSLLRRAEQSGSGEEHRVPQQFGFLARH